MSGTEWFKEKLGAIVTRARRTPPEQHRGLEYLLQGNEQEGQCATAGGGGVGSPSRLTNFFTKGHRLSCRRGSFDSDSNTEFGDKTTENKARSSSQQRSSDERGTFDSDSNTDFGHNTTEIKVDTVSAYGFQNLGCQTGSNEQQSSDDSYSNTDFGHKTGESSHGIQNLGLNEQQSNTEFGDKATEIKVSSPAHGFQNSNGLNEQQSNTEFGDKATEIKVGSSPHGFQKLVCQKGSNEQQSLGSDLNTDFGRETGESSNEFKDLGSNEQPSNTELGHKTTEIKVDMMSSDGFQNIGSQKGLNEELLNTVFGHNWSESDEESSSTSSDSPPVKWVYEEDNWDFQGALPWLFSGDDHVPRLSELVHEKDLNKGRHGYMTPKTEEVDTQVQRKSFWKEPPQVPIEISQILTSGSAVLPAASKHTLVWESRLDGSELESIGELIRNNPHTYQLWHRRCLLAEKWGTRKHAELDFTEEILISDPKNMHAWSHRQWVLEQLEGVEQDHAFKNELAFCGYLLKGDIHNQYAWNQRFFIVTRLSLGLGDEEADYAIKAILNEPENEYPWIYLRSLYKELGFGDGKLDDLFESVLFNGHFPNVDADLYDITQFNYVEMNIVMNRRKFIHALDTLLDLFFCGYEAKDKVCHQINFITPIKDGVMGVLNGIYSILLFADPSRKSYWRWRTDQVRRLKLPWMGYAEFYS